MKLPPTKSKAVSCPRSSSVVLINLAPVTKLSEDDEVVIAETPFL